MVKHILVIGVGRMGQRHLAGMKDFPHTVTVVDVSEKQLQIVTDMAKERKFKFRLICHTSLAQIPSDTRVDAAIIAATADCRLQNMKWALERGIDHILLEKPIAQSRAALDSIAKLADSSDADVHCHFYRRTLSHYAKMRARLTRSDRAGPLTMVVTSGAIGLGCNGIHYIDFALFLSGAHSARLAYGELQTTPIKSGRGAQFMDHGGIGIFHLSEGSRLILNVMADSSAPTVIQYYEGTNLLVVDQNEDIAIEYRRKQGSKKPNYLYGADYIRKELRGVEQEDLLANTRKWLAELNGRGTCGLPRVQEVMRSHHLLFDLLETSGASEFHFT